ncbi:MAG: hypothetical protein RR162_09845, partial [Oscillospiraceae bacterium]
MKKYPQRINGVHLFVDESGEKTLYHSGDKLYLGDTAIYTGMADVLSVSRQLDGKLFILDGLKMLIYYKKDDVYVCVTAES